MTISWLLLRATSVPEGDDWLGPREREVLSGFRHAKRRAEYRLGRYAAKTLMASEANVDRFDRIEIVAADDGAPEPFIDGTRLGSCISITHRSDAAACVLDPDATVGCDLEVIEPRTSRFVRDFFTEDELDAVVGTPRELRDRRIALIWSAKESALKVLRVGLRRDTRQVEVELQGVDAADGMWHALSATVRPENRLFMGWWRQEGDLVLTIMCNAPNAPALRSVDAAGRDH